MSFVSRTTSLQAYHLLLYRKPLHPELFGTVDTRRVVHGGYDFEAWIFSGGHALLFNYEGLSVSEVVSDRLAGLPERAQIALLPCAGERDFEESVAERIEYVTSIQTETLADHLYNATYREMLEHARECDCLCVEWEEPEVDLPSLSVVDIQRYQQEVDVQTYHLRGDCSLVLRTQTILRGLDDSERKPAK